MVKFIKAKNVLNAAYEVGVVINVNTGEIIRIAK